MTMPLYEAQRAMRATRQAAIKRGEVAVLDIGTSSIRCFVLKFDPSRQHALAEGIGSLSGHGAFRVIGAAVNRARGVRYGEISAMEETERAIRTVIQNAQRMANTRVDHVIACFAGGRPRSYGIEGKVDITGKPVGAPQIGRALASCDVPDYQDGYHEAREALHALPVNFAIDGRSGLTDPRGQVGDELSVDMHLMTVSGGAVRNILQAIRRCDLELAGLTHSAYASGMSALIEDEQELGAACIDLGAGSTGLSIFLRGQMIYGDALRMGGSQITGDIAQGLMVSRQVAEEVKIRHGGVLATGLDDRDYIDLPSEQGDWEHGTRQITRTELIGVIRPRVEEILEHVRASLDAAGFDYLPGQRVVLTGGGSLLPGIDGLASDILGRRVRLGHPVRVQGLPRRASDAHFSALVGLALHAVHPQDECWDFDLPDEIFARKPFHQAVRWFKENW
ncbi:cell division protein FtsA [Paracoccaceae bacterium GXU_MW_L88]